MSGLPGLTPSITTDAPVYQPGQPIQIQFTETNNTSQPIKFAYGPSDDGFDISEGGAVVFKSNGAINPMFLVLDTLQPGESKTFNFTWNGVLSTPLDGTAPTLTPGTFTVTNQLDRSVSATFQITSAISYTVTLDQQSYQAGQPIGISLTETNSSREPVTVNVNPTAFTVTNGLGQTLWQYHDSSASPAAETLEPGQSITQTATWDDIANVGASAGTNVWGSFKATSPNAPAALAPTGWVFENGLQGDGTHVGIGVPSPAPIPISPVPPFTGIGANVSTQPVGRHVLFTLTLTNFENAPVTISGRAGIARFTLEKNGKVIWRSTSNAKRATRKAQSLAPGDAIQLHAFWAAPSHQASVKAGGKPALFQLTATAGGHTATTVFEL